MTKKIKVTFLLDKKNLWIEKYLKIYDFRMKNKYSFKISKKFKNVKDQDIVFPLCYTRILPEFFLKKNNLVLIAHPSKLPENKGFSPIQNQILKKKKKFFISLIKATNKVDEGPIYLQSSFKLNGTELHDEFRKIEADEIFKIIKKFLKKFPNISSVDQNKGGNFNKKRTWKDSRLNINKTIKEQFNHLRISNNEEYPSFFYYKGNKFIIKIFKEKM